MQKAYQMQEDTEKQRNNSAKSGKGANFKGKKLGNNLALATSKQPSPESKSNGWKLRNCLIKSLEEVIKVGQEIKHTTVNLPNGESFELSLYAANTYNMMVKGVQGDVRAYDAFMKYTTALKIEQRLVDKDGNDAKQPPIIVFTKSEDEILKSLESND